MVMVGGTGSTCGLELVKVTTTGVVGFGFMLTPTVPTTVCPFWTVGQGFISTPVLGSRQVRETPTPVTPGSGTGHGGRGDGGDVPTVNVPGGMTPQVTSKPI